MTKLLLALLLLAAPAAADNEPHDPRGVVTFGIAEYSCRDAPSIAADCPGHLQATEPGDTGEIAGFVRIVFHDGFTFSIAYGNRAKVGLALVMVSAPACKKPIIREGGARFYESTIASTGFPAMIDGMSFGNDLSARLATHFGMDHPRQLPVLRAVYDMVPLGLVDERATRLATERTMRFALDWVEGCE